MKHLFTFLLCLVCCTMAFAQHDFKKVDNWLNEHTGEMGGRAILVVYKDGKLIYNRSVSEMTARQKFAERMIASRTGGNPDFSDYSLNSKIAIASCSKWLSAALVMTFVDEGRLKLTDTVGKYLPVLSKHGKGSITIWQCLSHLTAIKEPGLKEDLEDMRSERSMDDEIAKIAEMPMEGEPGKVFHYSNAGLQIAGAVIEKIGGKSFEDLFQEKIAGPLDMQHTDFGHKAVPLPAGCAKSTPEDYIHFLTMILNKGIYNGKRILSEESIAEMQLNRVTPDVKVVYSPAEAGGFGYGFGEWTMGRGAVTSPGLFGSFPWVDYNHGYAAFLMTFYIKNQGRNQNYKELKTMVDEAVK